MDAARVGRDVAADLAGAFRGEAQREQPVHGGRGGLHGLQRCAGVRGDRVAGRIDGADRLHPLQAEHDFGAGLEWRLPAHEPGIAALRHDGDALLVGKLEDGTHLRR